MNASMHLSPLNRTACSFAGGHNNAYYRVLKKLFVMRALAPHPRQKLPAVSSNMLPLIRYQQRQVVCVED